MNIVLWVLQILLAIVNALHGWLYVVWSPAMQENMRKRSPKPLGLHPAFRIFIGVAELLAAVGLILPAATGILPWLTPLAAAGFALIMASATVFHIKREEPAIPSAILCVLAAVVAYMRWQIIPL